MAEEQGYGRQQVRLADIVLAQHESEWLKLNFKRRVPEIAEVLDAEFADVHEFTRGGLAMPTVSRIIPPVSGQLSPLADPSARLREERQKGMEEGGGKDERGLHGD